MSTADGTTWQAVRDEVLRRIRAREWAPGEQIPHEADLAKELGCARATVNRALRDVADSGLIERRRRAGSRVALHPVRKATLDIPVIRKEIEARGGVHGYKLLSSELTEPPLSIRDVMPKANGPILHLLGLHTENGAPHALEDRWIDTGAVPDALDTDFSEISPNEWLVLNVPFEGGDIILSATVADAKAARALNCKAGAPLFVTERTTWHGARTLTSVRLLFAPGYRLRTEI